MFLFEFVWPPEPQDIPTFSIEIGIFLAGIVAGIIGLLIWKSYRVLAKEGLPECVSGFFVFGFHSLFDALDTIAEKPLRYDLDFMDSLFSIIGLTLIAIGIVRIAFYGREIWKEL